jgi:hypothetical protein
MEGLSDQEVQGVRGTVMTPGTLGSLRTVNRERG